MTIDTFRPHELVDIADLATVVEKFNREQVGDHPLFAEVVLYRSGEDVALITDAGSFGEAPAGSLSFEVKEKP